MLVTRKMKLDINGKLILQLFDDSWRYFFSLFLIFAVFSFLTVSGKAQSSVTTISNSKTFDLATVRKPVYRSIEEKPETILVSESKGWLLPLFVPYLNHLKSSLGLPSIIAVNFTDSGAAYEIDQFTKQGTVLNFTPSKALKLLDIAGASTFKNLPHNLSASATSILLLEKYVERSSDLVITDFSELESYLQASLFAAHFQLPLLPLDAELNETSLENTVRNKNVKRIFLISNKIPELLKNLKTLQIVLLPAEKISEIIIRKIGNNQIRNVIVSTLLNPFTQGISHPEDAIFFLPYISYLRSAPLFLSDSNGGKSVDRNLKKYLTKHSLIPRNITLFGDYARLHVIEADSDLRELIYDGDIELEPGSFYKPGNAMPFGVGRLPFEQISDVSLYYARLKYQNHYYQKKQRNYAMISNLIASEGATLKFAEAISKTTVKEMKNLGLKGKSYYAIEPDDWDMWNSALKSGIIIYEGHSDHFLPLQTTDPDDLFYKQNPYYHKFPLLILQSCNSLEDTEILANRGPIALVGSSTRVHSASGSSYINAYMDSLLYESSTLGEALRDTKNYFISVVNLKTKRGHQEQTKTRRVALTFRLWGDPEIKPFMQPLEPAKKDPIKLKAINSKAIEIETPKNFYSKIENEKYRLRSFPGSKQAGIVKSIKNSATGLRSIESFYFLKIPSENLNDQAFSAYQEKFNNGDVRNTLMKDPYDRWVYLLHYPQKEKKSSIIRLEPH